MICKDCQIDFDECPCEPPLDRPRELHVVIRLSETQLVAVIAAVLSVKDGQSSEMAVAGAREILGDAKYQVPG